MTPHRLCFALLVLIVQTCAVYGQDEIMKGSLTFVIDDTGSMEDEIRQVKEEVNIIFEKVLSSNASQIENFVLVTFNDPTAQLRTITKDRNEFKRALSSISVWGGADCPEYAMKGIELGLTESLPLSYLYVFTDASAKDHASFERIQSIAQKKQSQVVFILTGECRGGRSGPDYQVYHKVAEATNGQVFHMMKDDVKDILKYIEESITSRGIPLVNTKLPPGYNKIVKYHKDGYTDEIVISVTGEKPKITGVTGPDGSKLKTVSIVDKDAIAIVKVKGTKPGEHKVKVGSKSDTHVIITAKSNLNFQLGFSVYRPTSMKDTVTRPTPEGNAFLGIKLLGKGVKFTTAKILDLKNSVITELPLELVDEKAQFYRTPSFNPPFTMFRVSVSGIDVATNSSVSRVSLTPIQRQPNTETKVNTAPEITIEGAPKIIADYDAPLQLKCNVHGYPPPDIIWEKEDTGIRLPAKVELKEVPYDYVGILDIDKVNKNVTYQCKATNTIGVNIKYLEVETKRKIYFDVIESPKDIRVEYTKEGSLVCKVDAYPPASITWYKDGTVFSGNTNTDLSSDKSILTIKHMEPESQGKYTCEARNDLDRKVFVAKVAIFGVEIPVIDKSHEEIRALENTAAELSCRILRGIPKPNIRWLFQATGEDTFKVMRDTSETIRLTNVDKYRTGSYKCTAQNVLGADNFTMKLVVEYPPKIMEDVKVIRVKAYENGGITCDVMGIPVPSVRWFFNGTKLDPPEEILESRYHNLNFMATPSDAGYYMCQATNTHGSANKTVFLDVLEKPVIDRTVKEIRAAEKTTVVLTCRILQGNPKPDIRWSFQATGEDTFKVMRDTSETIRLTNVDKEQTGSYKCTAQNKLGVDYFTMDLVVEYPPKVKEDVKEIKSKDDDEVRISCDVTGVPTPTVIWYFNGTRLERTARMYKSSDNSLMFKARLSDTGSYRCVAENKLGSAKKTAFLRVYVPVSIEAPKVSTIETMVGKSTILNCRADGHPQPNIKWTFHSSDPTIPVKDITPTGGVASILLRNLQLDQEGLYTCVAETEIGGSANITYDVKVRAPPVIENVYTAKRFDAIEGDLALRIQCKATGSPKPSIVWIQNGLNLAIGSEWYDLEDDGTLVIKNIDRKSEGTYVCLAQNILGNDTEAYEVTVRGSPTHERPTNTVFIEEGKTVDIKCDIPHKSTDQMWWYKDGVPIAAEELTLYNVTRSDDGLYTCRISEPSKSRSITTKVVIGFKPVFTSDEEDTVEFVRGADSEILSCEAYGVPRPKTASWKHNGEPLNTTSMSHPLGMVLGATGTYECVVSNEFGSINRTFKVTSRDCILDLKRDFPEKQPIMHSPSLGWPVFPVEDGYMIIPHRDYFYFNCPSLFTDPSLPKTTNLIAFCERDNKIKVSGKIYNFADIKCQSEVKPEVSKTGIACMPGNTENIKVGYRVYNMLLEVYDICLDKERNVPLFTRHKLSPDHTDRSSEAQWSNSMLPQDFHSLYDCRRQAYDIPSSLGPELRGECCFGRRQLVSSHDLLPGIPASVTYDYLNVVPHWSSCNTKNWEEVEKRVRNLVKVAGRDLIISTGTSSPRHAELSTDVTLHDASGVTQPVAQYLWKVVQDPSTLSSLAIIQVNIPDLSPAEASKHVLCYNICADDNIGWMANSNWDNVNDGFTYCCSILEFERGFGYDKRFSPGLNRVLIDASLIPDYYLVKK